ncbi:protein-tyrosine phosphatase-like protein [Chaetomium fimeti]|uniref:protein-tyrosine-phosphatase n=1 Tax=Chaetomium fimeti TaxID=1854472 RepID=A0AAE0LNM7_9PEZI|nr:protein-tyrosine phosphatase-like protein [Chaetomium fimeti]
MPTTQPTTHPAQEDDHEARFTSCSRIIPNLFLGNVVASYHIPTLQEHDISAVVSVIEDNNPRWELQEYRALIPAENHLIVPAGDTDTQDLLVHLQQICDFIDAQHEVGRRVLVHCIAGVSRSPTVVVAYLVRKWRKGLDKTLKYVKGKRKEVRPSPNFMEQLRVWEEVAYEMWEDSDAKTAKDPYQAYLERRKERLRKRLCVS